MFIRHLEDRSFKMPWAELFLTLGSMLSGAMLGSWTRYKREGLGKRLESITATLGVMLLLTTVVIALSSNWQLLGDINEKTWLAGLLLGPVGTLLGYVPARVHRLEERQARTIGIEVGEVNIGVAYAMMLLVWPEGARQDAVFSGIIACECSRPFEPLLPHILLARHKGVSHAQE